MTLPRVPRGTHSDAARLVLPSWLTPAFARQWLAREGALGGHPHKDERHSQVDRYAAVARETDWTGQGRHLVWMEPYASPSAPRPAQDKTPPADETEAARRFGQLAAASIRQGHVEAMIVNALLDGDQPWSARLAQLQKLLDQ